MTLPQARRFTIAGIELFGGLAGIAWVAPQIGAHSSAMWFLIAVCILLFYVASFAAGMLLLRDHPWGASLSLYLQVPQLVYVYSSTLVFNIYSGFSASIALTTPLHLSFNFFPGSAAIFTVLNDFAHVTLGVNVAAAIVLWQLYMYLEAKDASAKPEPAPSLGGAV